jgi:hypothetical protein
MFSSARLNFQSFHYDRSSLAREVLYHLSPQVFIGISLTDFNLESFDDTSIKCLYELFFCECSKYINDYHLVCLHTPNSGELKQSLV